MLDLYPIRDDRHVVRCFDLNADAERTCLIHERGGDAACQRNKLQPGRSRVTLRDELPQSLDDVARPARFRLDLRQRVGDQRIIG